MQKFLFTYLLTHSFCGSISACGEKEKRALNSSSLSISIKTELEQISILFTLVQVSEEIIDR